MLLDRPQGERTTKLQAFGMIDQSLALSSPAYFRLRNQDPDPVQRDGRTPRARQQKPQAASDVLSAVTCNLTSSQQILRDAAAKRQILAEEWLSATDATARINSSPSFQGRSASQLRRTGQLLGVYVSQPTSCYRYPTWQFRPDGQLVDHLAEIMSVLRDFGPFLREPEGLRRTTGWGEVEWFLSPHVLLDGDSPAAVLTADPARVLRAARLEFESDS